MGQLAKPGCINKIDKHGWGDDISQCEKCCTGKGIGDLPCKISLEVYEIIGSISSLDGEDRDIVENIFEDLIQHAEEDDILMGLHPDIVKGVDYNILKYFTLLGMKTDMERGK